MKRLPKSLLALLLLLPFYSIAQDYVLPTSVVLTSKDDYARYEKDVINASKWLESTPLGPDIEKRREIGSFVVKWIMGSTTVSVELNSFETQLADKNPPFLALYMAAYARYCLENNYSKDTLKAATAAVKSVITCYSLGGDVKKDKLLEKAIAANKKGKLEEWVKANREAK